jgi:type I restriction enzyme S subunit
MKVKVLSTKPLAVVIPDKDAKALETIDAGAAYTAYLHSEVGKFKQYPLGKYLDLISNTINPGSARHRDQTFDYVDLREVDEIFGQILLTRKVQGSQIGSSKHRFRKGDFLFAKIMPSLANKKVAYVFQDVSNGVASTEFLVLRLKPDADINSFFLFRALRSDHFTQQAVANVTGATGRLRISPDTLLSLKIIVPPTEVQDQIGSVVEGEFRLRAIAVEETARADDISSQTLGPSTIRTAQTTRRRSTRNSRSGSTCRVLSRRRAAMTDKTSLN